MDAAALLILPESPRWLVVNNRLDEALSVIRRVYMSVGLANGAEPPAIDMPMSSAVLNVTSLHDIQPPLGMSPFGGAWLTLPR